MLLAKFLNFRLILLNRIHYSVSVHVSRLWSISIIRENLKSSSKNLPFVFFQLLKTSKLADPVHYDSIRNLPEELAEKTVDFNEGLKRQRREERNRMLNP